MNINTLMKISDAMFSRSYSILDYNSSYLFLIGGACHLCSTALIISYEAYQNTVYYNKVNATYNMTAKLSIDEVNSLPDNKFECVFGNVIELCPAAAIQVKKSRPFEKLLDLQDAFNNYLQDLSFEDKVHILKLHPDLAGRLAAQGKLTRESTFEQRSAGLHDLTPQQKNNIDEYNERYNIKFGFPFIICARENKVESIIYGLHKRYCNTKEQEVIIALEEVKKICKIRILDIVKDNK